MSLFAEKNAVNAIYSVLFEKKTLKSNYTPQEKYYIHSVIRQFFKLNFYLKNLCSSPPPKKITCLLLLGLFRLIDNPQETEKIINNQVSLAKGVGPKGFSGLVNACLRKFTKNQKKLEIKARGDIEARFLHPKWMIEKIKAQYPDSWREQLYLNNQEPSLSLRVNCQKISKEAYSKKLRLENIKHTTPASPPFAIVIQQSIAIKRLPGFAQGLFSVQGLASQQVPFLLNLQEKMTVFGCLCCPWRQNDRPTGTHPLSTSNRC